MKKVLLTLALLAAATSAFAADGKITFYNRGYTMLDGSTANSNTPHNGGIFQYNGGQDGVVGAGPGFTAGLFLGGVESATPLATAAFRAAPNGSFFTAASTADVTIPGVAVGQTATLTIKAWDSSFASYEAAAAANGQRGFQTFTSQPLGGANAPNPDVFIPGLTGFTGFTMVPEPSTYALGIAGLGALAMMRRRRK